MADSLIDSGTAIADNTDDEDTLPDEHAEPALMYMPFRSQFITYVDALIPGMAMHDVLGMRGTLWATTVI
jgi:hypothetical protein